MVLVFAPQGGPGVKNKSPNPDKWDYVRVSKDATLIDKISFETIGSPWAISNAILSEDNQVYLYGPANLDKKGKYLNAIVGGLTSFDNIQVMKVGEGTIKYLTNANLKELNSKLVKPSNLKKGDSYSGKDLTFEQNYTLTAAGDLLFTAQANDHSALYCFHFGPDGKFKAQYVIASEDQPKEVGIDHAIFENPDQQSVSVFIAELTKVDKNRALKYPRMATINIKDAKISAVQTFGYDKKGEYFLDDIYPYTFIDNGQKIVFFSRDAKDAKLWLGRVKIGLWDFSNTGYFIYSEYGCVCKQNDYADIAGWIALAAETLSHTFIKSIKPLDAIMVKSLLLRRSAFFLKVLLFLQMYSQEIQANSNWSQNSTDVQKIILEDITLDRRRIAKATLSDKVFQLKKISNTTLDQKLIR